MERNTDYPEFSLVDMKVIKNVLMLENKKVPNIKTDITYEYNKAQLMFGIAYTHDDARLLFSKDEFGLLNSFKDSLVAHLSLKLFVVPGRFELKTYVNYNKHPKTWVLITDSNIDYLNDGEKCCMKMIIYKYNELTESCSQSENEDNKSLGSVFTSQNNTTWDFNPNTNVKYTAFVGGDKISIGKIENPKLPITLQTTPNGMNQFYDLYKTEENEFVELSPMTGVESLEHLENLNNPVQSMDLYGGYKSSSRRILPSGKYLITKSDYNQNTKSYSLIPFNPKRIEVDNVWVTMYEITDLNGIYSPFTTLVEIELDEYCDEYCDEYKNVTSGYYYVKKV